MNLQTLRNLIINVLDNENGVNNTVVKDIEDLCESNGWDDILDKIEYEEEGAFLWETDAEELRKIQLAP